VRNLAFGLTLGIAQPGVSHVCYGRDVSSEISQRELRNNSGDIMRRLDEGEAFIVTRNGVPVGELVPLRRRRIVNGPALAAAFRGAPRIDYQRLRADLDRCVDQDIDPHG
jgi:prevent-host-death family protein